ncbi:MAG: aldehyde dehydrogenase family protein [Leptospirillia bacterium]
MDAHTLNIAGVSHPAESTDSVINPYTGDTVALVAQAGPDLVETAISAAVDAFKILSAWPAHQRAGLLSNTAGGIARRRAELAASITAEGGKPITQSLGEVDRAITTFTLAAEEAKRMGGEVIPTDGTPAGEGYVALTRRFAMGPISAISPFNFPLNLVAHKLAPALAVGCPMVLKPPVQTPLTPLMLGDIVAEAGAPPGAFTVLPCSVEAAQPLITDARIKMLSFTGSGAVGWHLKGLAGKKRVALELGGNAAAVVCEGADLEFAARRIAFGAFSYAGQICISVQRIFVQASVYDDFVAALVRETEALTVGDPTDPQTVVGPLIDSAAAERVACWIKEAEAGGASLLTGGKRDGNIITPTLLADADAGLKVCCDEVFGPVAVVTRFNTFDDAIARVNDSDYGLQTGVFTPNLSDAMTAFEQIETGGLIVGDIPTLRFDHTPYGGVKDSGLGREGVRYAMEEMTEQRLMVIRK